jgi:peptidoglycan/LPS O-acetylase OafA/YrhL
MSQATAFGKTGATTALHRYAHIDAMRAFAVGVVVLGHAGLGDIIPGGSGVTIFFAISGFIITNLLLKEKVRSGGFNLRGFYARRLIKIFPPFLVAIAIPTIFVAFYQEIRWELFASQVLFYFNWIYMSNGDASLLPGSGVVWSLSIEEQFYIGFALIWLFAVRSARYVRLLTIVATIGAVAPLAIRFFIAITDFSHSRVYYGTDTRLDAIAIGILAAILNFKLTDATQKPAYLTQVGLFLKRDATLLIAVLLYFASLVIRDDVFRETLRYSMQSAAAALIILYGLLIPTTSSFVRKAFESITALRIIQVIGLASYSIYLVHLQLTTLAERLLPALPGPALIVLNTAIGVSAGCLMWLIIEKPAERFKKRFLQTPIASK